MHPGEQRVDEAERRKERANEDAIGRRISSDPTRSAHAVPSHSAVLYRRGARYASQGLALLAGAVVSFFVTRIFTPEAFESWGWRIPFLVGLLIGPVGIFIAFPEGATLRRGVRRDRHVQSVTRSR
jgi:MFS family permease